MMNKVNRSKIKTVQPSRPKRAFKLRALPLAMAGIFMSHAVWAEDIRLPRIDVIGAAESLAADNPGSVAIVSRQDIEETQPLSVQDALRKVPGIHTVETEGYGFYPRITIRGIGSDMSRKVLLLEDGAPIALGPYTDPSAYYSPPIERMDSIEILKGSGTLRHGPSTIGGAVNYITRQPTTKAGGMLDVKVGTQNFKSVMGEYGGAVGDGLASVSVLHKEGDGFRNMPFKLDDLVLKGGLAVGDQQFVGVKLTHYRLNANNTYLGLTQAEYDADPDLNRAVNDLMKVARSSLDVNHEYVISPTASLKTLVYYNQAKRDWWRENYTFNAVTGLNDMSGQEQGRLRDFEVMGIDSRLNFAHQALDINNETELGVRLHTEEMINRRTGNAPAGSQTVTALLREDDTRKADALAMFAENRFHVSANTIVTPGLRVESYRQERDIRTWNSLPVGTQTATGNTEVVPGLGAIWKLDPDTSVFAGVHKGFAPPRVQDAVSNSGTAVDLDAERSTNYEIGVRGKWSRGQYELTAFRLDFQNQLVSQTESGGAGSQQTNAGATLNQGVELGGDLGLGGGFSVGGNYTWLPVAKLDSVRVIAGVDRNGNRLSYAPEHVLNASLNYRQGEVQLALAANYVSSQYANLENTEVGTADGKAGLIEGRTVLDLSASYQLNKSTKVYGTVKNLADTKYIASRAPEGIFPGAERSLQLGLKLDI